MNNLNLPLTNQPDFIYECLKCGEQSPLDQFEDTECDGDVLGKCPKCGVFTIILDVSPENEKEDLTF